MRLGMGLEVHTVSHAVYMDGAMNGHGTYMILGLCLGMYMGWGWRLKMYIYSLSNPGRWLRFKIGNGQGFNNYHFMIVKPLPSGLTYVFVPVGQRRGNIYIYT